MVKLITINENIRVTDFTCDFSPPHKDVDNRRRLDNMVAEYWSSPCKSVRGKTPSPSHVTTTMKENDDDDAFYDEPDELDVTLTEEKKAMPSKDSIKQNYPPCNRAFALRMMNPMSYSQNHQSPFDGEIQPVVKKPIAKSIDGRRSTENSFDDTSLSPSSSLASFQDNMELYDIDEHDQVHGVLPEQSSAKLNRSFESNRSNKKSSRVTSVGGKATTNGFMSRSYSSNDGFNGSSSSFTRGSNTRQSTPVRYRKTSSPDKPLQNGRQSPRKAIRSDVSNYLEQNNQMKEGSSLRRSQSLRDCARPKVTVRNVDVKTPATKLRVASTRSSELRAKKNISNAKAATPSKTDIKATKKQQKKVLSSNKTKNAEDESDTSIIVNSERDTYHPHNIPRNVKNGKRQQSRDRRDSTLSEASSIDSYDSALQMSSPSTPSVLPAMDSGSLKVTPLPSHDAFSKKLADVCTMISDHYPGDFHLLETLVEMQAAYEERTELVENTFSQLRNKCYHLETKLSKGPNIPGMVIPLMRATTTFQAQLQTIMDSQNSTRNTIDKATQVSESTNDLDSATTFHEISCEANNVIVELEKLSLSRSQSTSSPKLEFEELESSPQHDTLPNGTASDNSDSYAVINESETSDV